MKREKPNKIQQSDVYYQLVSQHVSGIIMPIFRDQRTCVTAYGVLIWFCWMWLVAGMRALLSANLYVLLCVQ